MSKQPFIYAISDFSNGNIVVRHKLIENDYRMHWHNCCELELILSGRGEQVLNDSTYPLRSGELYMLTPADCHSIHVDEPLDVIGIMFEDKLISQNLYERILTNETLGINLRTNLSGKNFNIVQSLFDALICEDGRKSGEYEFENMYIGHLIDCLIIELLRSLQRGEGVIEKSPIGTAILYLHSHFTENVTLDTLAGVTHLSRNYFSEMFRSYTRRTFKSYLIDLRMKNACRLLANTEMSITDVCFACGFDSFSNFMRTFKSRYGTSPLKFRAENRSDEQLIK
ncbi:MAG: AraC family transcriptional regulator [Clostridiales bacterium]|nr:AraC family transcriptional regulator [Clostridiales bacterium]